MAAFDPTVISFLNTWHVSSLYFVTQSERDWLPIIILDASPRRMGCCWCGGTLDRTLITSKHVPPTKPHTYPRGCSLSRLDISRPRGVGRGVYDTYFSRWWMTAQWWMCVCLWPGRTDFPRGTTVGSGSISRWKCVASCLNDTDNRRGRSYTTVLGNDESTDWLHRLWLVLFSEYELSTSAGLVCLLVS